MRWETFEPPTWDERFVEVEVICCGLCGSDLHHLGEGWRPEPWPIVAGHEIVGKIVRLGSEVSTLKLGDIVGCGAQVDACGDCHECSVRAARAQEFDHH